MCLRKSCFQDMIVSPSPSPISPHMLQSNDLCLITGYKCRTSSDRLHIRIQIFIIKPSLRMKVMAVLSPVRDPCLDAAASLAAAFPNIPAVRGNRSSLMEGRGRGRPWMLWGQKRGSNKGEEKLKPFDQHISLYNLVLLPFFCFLRQKNW